MIVPENVINKINEKFKVEEEVFTVPLAEIYN